MRVRVGAAVALARDLTNEPPATMTPRHLAQVAMTLAENDPSLTATVWDETTIEAEKLGGLRGVSLGSDQPPRLIRLVYQPAGRGTDRDGRPHVVLVGKGITFDSGGLSIKSAEGMKTMKSDMAGAAAVLGAMSVLGDAGVEVKVTAIVPASENLPGPEAIKPGDVLRFRNGKTAKAGSILAGLFLKEFVGDVPWAHLDIASTSWTDTDDGLTTKGATGFGVRTLVELLSSYQPLSSRGRGQGPSPEPAS